MKKLSITLAVFLVVASLALILNSSHNTSSSSQTSTLQSKQRQKSNNHSPSHSLKTPPRQQDHDTVAFINSQLDLLLTENFSDFSLKEVRAACAKLQSTASIIDLLYHSELGWSIFVPETKIGNNNHSLICVSLVQGGKRGQSLHFNRGKRGQSLHFNIFRFSSPLLLEYYSSCHGSSSSFYLPRGHLSCDGER